MERTRFVLIGTGNVGLQMLEMLSRDYQVLVVDANEEALELARKVRGESLQTLLGDATSRLVLEQAEVEKSDAVVLTTTTEKINIEVARVLKEHFNVPRVLSIGITAKGIEQLESFGVEVESIFEVSATGLRNRLTQATKAVHGIGVGKDEILEVEVHTYSRLTNRSLARINPRNWRVGIIYRDGNIIVPRGETTLRPDDRVIILGDPKVVQIVAERLSLRFMDFPHEYGDSGFINLRGKEEQAYLDEICYLFEILPLEKAVILAAPAAAEMAKDLQKRLRKANIERVSIVEKNKALPEAIQNAVHSTGDNPALLICEREVFFPSESFLPGLGRNRHQMEETFRAAACPLLLAAGSQPYEKVVIPCLNNERSERSLEAAFEIASDIECTLEALAVKPSDYIASEDEIAFFEKLPQTISDLSMAYHGRMKRRELNGNPVKAVLSTLPEYHLLVIENELEPRGGYLRKIFQPDSSWHILVRSPISSLVMPPSSIIS